MAKNWKKIRKGLDTCFKYYSLSQSVSESVGENKTI